MSFLICKKCKSGIHTSILETMSLEMRTDLGWPIDGNHAPGDCDGEVEIVSDQQAGAGPGYVPKRLDN